MRSQCTQTPMPVVDHSAHVLAGQMSPFFLSLHWRQIVGIVLFQGGYRSLLGQRELKPEHRDGRSRAEHQAMV